MLAGLQVRSTGIQSRLASNLALTGPKIPFKDITGTPSSETFHHPLRIFVLSVSLPLFFNISLCAPRPLVP